MAHEGDAAKTDVWREDWRERRHPARRMQLSPCRKRQMVAINPSKQEHPRAREKSSGIGLIKSLFENILLNKYSEVAKDVSGFLVGV
jgi:hypothetical protein